MTEQKENIILECEEFEANKHLETGRYKLIGNYVRERSRFDAEYNSSVGYVERKMIYCLISKNYL